MVHEAWGSAPAQAGEQDADLSEVLAVVAHDLRSPLTVIRGFADSAVEHWNDFDDQRKVELARGVVRNAALLGLRLERGVMAARLQAGVLEVDPEELDMGALARRVVNDAVAGGTDREVRVSVAGDPPPAWADEQCQWQILANLVTNAVRHSTAGAPVTVKIGAGRRPPAGAAPHAGPAHVEVSVADAGPGIPAGDRERLFRPFNRLERALAGDGRRRGTTAGLGLALCWRLVPMQGGSIRYGTTARGGSVFTYTVPAAAGDPDRPA